MNKDAICHFGMRLDQFGPIDKPAQTNTSLRHNTIAKVNQPSFKQSLLKTITDIDRFKWEKDSICKDRVANRECDGIL